jgi:3-deoxy-manno-octulosonate cytidylyltransferase (CMP-KDO synthetase)
MIQHVYERTKSASLVEKVFVATDSETIFEAVEGFGGRAVMTSEKHLSGTDRIAEAAEKIVIQDRDIIVNVQGDEPLIHPQMIDEVIRLMNDKTASIGTLIKKIEDPVEINNPNVVKAVFDRNGFALYFSRSPIPHHRGDEMNYKGYFKHIGIYAYRKKALLQFAALPPSPLEEIEKLEQLRALENKMTIKVYETSYETIGVDTPADAERVEQCLNISSLQAV